MFRILYIPDGILSEDIFKSRDMAEGYIKYIVVCAAETRNRVSKEEFEIVFIPGH